MLHTLFEAAIDRDLLGTDANPVARIKPLEEKRVRPKYWKTEEDEARYVLACTELGPVYRMWSVLALGQGLRSSEALALKNSDIDEERGTITVQRIVETVSLKICERTKGQREGGSYTVPLFDQTRQELLRWRSQTPFKRPNDFVLHDRMGRHLHYWNIEWRHHKAIKAARLVRIGTHGLRHSYANKLERAGFTRSEVQELLGHENIQTTERYTHADVDHLVRKAQAVRFGSKWLSSVSPERGGQKLPRLFSAGYEEKP